MADKTLENDWICDTRLFMGPMLNNKNKRKTVFIFGLPIIRTTTNPYLKLNNDIHFKLRAKNANSLRNVLFRR